MSDKGIAPEDINLNLAEEKPQSNFLSVIQTIASLGLGLIALITATGYVIVSAYLIQFTDIQGYSISTNQYIQAGVFFSIPASLTFLLLRYTMYSSAKVSEKDTFPRIEKILRKIIYPETRIHTAILALLLIFSGAFTYGMLFYVPGSPIINLGRPPTVILILKSDFKPSYFGLQASKLNPQWTEVVQLLVQLDDGVLIRANDGTVVSVKNDDIAGILDDEKRSAPSPTPTATSAPTATITPSPTP